MKWDAEKYDFVKAPQVDDGRELITMAEVRTTDSILDIGCGTGKHTEWRRKQPFSKRYMPVFIQGKK